MNDLEDVLQVEKVVDCQNLLGEGVTWDAATQTLLWVDIDGRLLNRLHSDGRHEIKTLQSPTSVVVPTINGDLLAVSGLSIGLLAVDGGIPNSLVELPNDGDGYANDGRCDPQGRLWIGTVDRSGANLGGVFCLNDKGVVRRVRTGRALANGIDWSPDGTKCYHVDSLFRTLDELTLDAQGLPISERTIAKFNEMPDGMSVDEEGCIWVALWDGGGVVRLTPDGTIDLRVEVPGGWITSCAFGGSDLRTLYITSARADIDAERARSLPFAGALFACDVGVVGRGYTPFG